MPGGHVIAEYADRVVFWLDKIRTCLIELLCMRFSRIGDVVGAQVTGVPIGGPCSGILVDLIFSVLELYTDEFFWPSLATKHNMVGPMSRWIATARYADDTIALSPWICQFCLEHIMTRTYAPQAGIEKTTETFHVNSFSFVKFLDFWILLDWSSIEFIPIRQTRSPSFMAT